MEGRGDSRSEVVDGPKRGFIATVGAAPYVAVVVKIKSRDAYFHPGALERYNMGEAYIQSVDGIKALGIGRAGFKPNGRVFPWSSSGKDFRKGGARAK